jgi:hypothetical protein
VNPKNENPKFLGDWEGSFTVHVLIVYSLNPKPVIKDGVCQVLTLSAPLNYSLASCRLVTLGPS